MSASYERATFSSSPKPYSSVLKSGLAISWSGMRGVVSLAAALALPADGPAGGGFPHRDLVVLTAFCVVLGTLVLQGLTLRPLLSRLGLRDDDPVGREIGRARARVLQAASASIARERSEAATALRQEYDALLRQAEQEPKGEVAGGLPHDHLRRRAVDAARETLLGLRDSGEIGDDAFHALEEELDRIELSVAR